MEREEQLTEGLNNLFTDDPVNWIKWGIVFAVLVITYIFAIKIYGKVSWLLSRERKRDKALALDHVITANLVKSWVSTKEKNGRKEHCCHATYEYTVNGKVRKYRALFYDTRIPLRTLQLYYMNSPKKVFAVDDYHWENHKGLVMLPIILLPWIMAVLVMWILKIPIDQVK